MNHCENRISSSFYRYIWQRFWQHRLGKTWVVLLSPILILVFVGPYLSGYQEETMYLIDKNQPPCAQFWFGTDDLGRDIFYTHLAWSTHSLTIGLLAALIDLGVGLLWGGVSGLTVAP